MTFPSIDGQNIHQVTCFLDYYHGLLAAVEGEGEYHVEKRRRERLQGFLRASREHLVAARITIPATDADTGRTLDSLGPGVRLTPGMLSIEFGQPVELLQKLHTLAQAIAHEFEKFEGMAKPAPMATS